MQLKHILSEHPKTDIIIFETVNIVYLKTSFQHIVLWKEIFSCIDMLHFAYLLT
jgi:hypothetical protein